MKSHVQKLLWVLVLAGCAGQIDGVGDETEDSRRVDHDSQAVAVTTQALDLTALAGSTPTSSGVVTLKPIYDTYTFTAGSAPTQMKSGSTHVCALTAFSGSFNTSDAFASVYKTTSWYVKAGKNNSSGATCYPLSAFDTCSPDGCPAPATTSSRRVSSSTTEDGYAQVWAKSVATILEGFGGHFEEGASVRVVQAPQGLPNASTIETITNNTQTDSRYIEAVGLDFKPKDGRAVEVIGPDGTVGDAANIHSFALNRTTTGTSSYYMSDPRSSMCYFTQIGGNFNSGEWAQIVPATDSSGRPVWRMDAHVGSSTGTVHLRARCIELYQGYEELVPL